MKLSKRDNTGVMLSLTTQGETLYRKTKLRIELDHEYTIDTDGVVRNETNGKTLKGTSITRNNRYVKIHLDKFYPLHRLVAEHFLPNPEGLPQVNHKNGNRYDNTVANLEWCSAQDNVKHAYASKLKSNHGSKNPFRKLSEDDVRRIWALRDTNLTAKQIRDRLNLGVSVACVKAVRSGKNWSSITSQLA